MPAATILQELGDLITSKQAVITLESVEEARVDDLLRALAAEQRLPLFTWTITRGLQRADSPSPGAVYGTYEPMMLCRHLATLTLEAIFHLRDLAPHLTEPGVIRAFKEAAQTFAGRRGFLVLTGPTISLPNDLAHDAVQLRLPLPDREEMKELLHSVVESLRSHRKVELALGPAALDEVLQALSGMTLNQARQALSMAMASDGKLSVEDLPQLIKRKAKTLAEGSLLDVHPPGEGALELGGFASLKAWLERARVGFTAEAAALGLRPPRGVLIVGVQGCGKSLAAKGIAQLWRQPLLKLDAGRLYDKYVGESEKNLRKALAVAEAMAPCVLWIDEIEKAFASGGDADGGLSRRMLGSFLTWMQERKARVFVAATANDLSALPPEFLRKGRFDETFFVDLPDAAEREAIFRIHLSQRRQDLEAFDLCALAAASEGFSGAEIEQTVVNGLYRSLHNKAALTSASLADELRQTVPLSVSRREDIARLREFARGRFVPVR
jgi:AAA+ superfamily predicted ATPase